MVQVEPDWQMLDQIVINKLQHVMELDSLGTSRPISLSVDHPKEIAEIFDLITYDKGKHLL